MTRTLTCLAVIMAVALAVPSIVSAQAKPDFNGKWVQDMQKSDPPPQGGPGGGGGRGPAGPQTITIKQVAASLTIERETPNGVVKAVHKLDGTESVNDTGRGSSKTKSNWVGNTLVTAGTQTMTMQGNEVTMETKEVRSLAADGTMTVVTTTKSPMGERTRKVVFKKG